MVQRCEKPDTPQYRHYGGRGISVCREWHEFKTFLAWALDNGYAPGLSIDRADNDGNYEPANCRWVPQSENVRNRRSSLYLTAFNETKMAKDWTFDPRCAVKYDVLVRRIRECWEPEEAITTPSKRSLRPGSIPRGILLTQLRQLWRGSDPTSERAQTIIEIIALFTGQSEELVLKTLQEGN